MTITDKEKQVLERVFSNEDTADVLVKAFQDKLGTLSIKFLRKAAITMQEAGDNKLAEEKVQNIFLAEQLAASAVESLKSEYGPQPEEGTEEEENPAK